MSEQPKQWIILRTDLGLTPGQMVAQGAHASVACLTAEFSHFTVPHPINKGEGLRRFSFTCDMRSAADLWISESFTKVVVTVSSGRELEDIYRVVSERGILCSLIRDSLRGAPSCVTAAAVGPAFPSEVKDVVGTLPLL